MDLLAELAKATCGPTCQHWLLAWGGDSPHLVPLNDALGHEAEDCACLPAIEPIKRTDGAVAFMAIHSAWDGRT
jgi:hypothetical protein